MSSPTDRKGKATKTTVSGSRAATNGKSAGKSIITSPAKKKLPPAKSAASKSKLNQSTKLPPPSKAQALLNSASPRIASAMKAKSEKSKLNGAAPGIKIASTQSTRGVSRATKAVAERGTGAANGAARTNSVTVNAQPQSVSNRSAAKPSVSAIKTSPVKVLASTSLKMTKTSQGNNGEAATVSERPKAAKSNGKHVDVVLPAGYRPTETEPFMNERQRRYFRNKLVAWKEDIVRQNMETLQGLHEDSAQHADLADRATSETDRALELRARDRQRKLISKIDAAIARIEDGSYGYCEETGEPISLKRLDARPIATMSIEAQERHERRERVFRED